MPRLSSTSSPAWWPWRSLSALKWSRSSTSADSGAPVRVDWATIRISASWTERALGSRVSGSVAARCSAIARLRRLARTGAACETAPTTRSRSSGLIARSLMTSSEPMTSPPMTDGTQSAAPSLRWHSSQVCSGAAPGVRSWVPARRIARHERGLASASASASPGIAAGSVLAASELPLALRVSTTAFVPGASRSARRRSSSFASPSSSAPCSASTYSRRCLPRARSRPAWRSSANIPSENTVVLNSSTKIKETQRECCSRSCVCCSTCARSEAAAERIRSISTLRSCASSMLNAARAAAIHLVDRRSRVRLPAARRRGEVADEARGRRLRGAPWRCAAPRRTRSARGGRARGTPARRSARSRAGPSPGRASPVNRSFETRSSPCMPMTASRCCPVMIQTLPPTAMMVSASSSRRRA